MLALVAGAGVAGCVVAVALRRAGFDVALVDAADHASDGVGAFLTLGANGVDALAAIGLGDAVGDLGFTTPEMVLRDRHHRRLVTFPAGAPREDGLAVRTMRRTDLYGALRDAAVAAGVDVAYGRRITGARTGPEGVEATLADGETLRADLLVGADGLGSRVRAAIDPAAPRARYTGLLNTGGYAQRPDDPAFTDAAPGVANFCFGTRCFLGWLRTPDGDVWWFANPPSRRELDRADLAALSDGQWREHLWVLFAGDGLPLDALLAGTDDVFAGWNTYDFPRVPTWHSGRMVIIGDAAHAVSPSAGQGASMAIEDAVVLAQCLRDQPDVEAAFTRYEAARRRRVEAIVARGKRTGDQKAAGPLGRVVRDRLVMPWLARSIARGGTASDAWITSHHLSWEADMSAAAPGR